ncbi:hypothetical protein MRX96_044906 [Rhipicephalus microplus]
MYVGTNVISKTFVQEIILDSVTLCTLGIGTAFGESVLDNSPHSATVVTNEYCELLRIEQRDFRSIWERNRHLMEDIVSPLSTLRTISSSTRRRESRAQSNGTLRTIPPPAASTAKPPAAEPAPLPSRHPPSPTEPFHTNRLLVSQPTAQVHRAGWVLRTLLLFQAPQLVRDRKYHMRHFKRCMVGTEMVDWLLQVPATHVRLNSRAQAAGMWQVLLEEGAINHVTREHQFKDKYMFYRFREDEEEPTKLPTSEDRAQAEEELQDVLLLLMQLTPDAVLRMILRKPPMERTLDDLDLIYEELLHIKALSHLSNSVKRELYGVMIFESHPKAGTILFNQGDEGKSWYIILRGSVNVVIYGKDVEANTVRLKEHGQDVLLLQKIPADARNTNGAHSHYKYMVMAGTPQKMLEHLLETRIDTRTEESSGEKEFILANKRRVVQFANSWALTVREAFFEDPVIQAFVDELLKAVKEDSTKYAGCLQEELRTMTRIMDLQEKYVKEHECAAPQRWKVGPFGHIRHLSSGSTTSEDTVDVHRPIKPNDEKRIAFKDSEVSVPTGLSINGRVFISPADHLDALHMIGQTLRSLRHSRSQRLNLEPPPPGKAQQDVREYIRTLKVIDNQRRLTQLSHALEPRRP